MKEKGVPHTAGGEATAELRVSVSASSIAAFMDASLARFDPAISNAVPCAGLVRIIHRLASRGCGSPTVTFTVCSRSIDQSHGTGKATSKCAGRVFSRCASSHCSHQSCA